jgi:hypothetical protein
MLNNIPIKTQITNIQTKTKTIITTKQVKNNNLTNNTNISINTKYHQQIPYTLRRVGLLTLINNKTGSASRPRHKTETEYQLINNWLPNSITNHIPKDNINTHSSIKQLAKIIPALPNLFTITKFTLTEYQKIKK